MLAWPTARGASIAVLVEDASLSAAPGILEQVEAAAESGLMRVQGVDVLSRRHLEKILAEQGLAYGNIVNDRARLGRLAGADILLVVELIQNNNTRLERTNSAYGITERVVSTRNDASLAFKALDVEGGRVLAQRRFSERATGADQALGACLHQLEDTLSSTPFPSMVPDDPLVRHELLIHPTANGEKLNGLDVYIDGNFIGNTPIHTDAEEGVRDISIRKGQSILWSNRVRILNKIWLTPELGSL